MIVAVVRGRWLLWWLLTTLSVAFLDFFFRELAVRDHLAFLRDVTVARLIHAVCKLDKISGKKPTVRHTLKNPSSFTFAVLAAAS